MQFPFRIGPAHPLPSTTRYGLEQDRVADLGGYDGGLFRAGDGAGRPGHHANSAFLHPPAGCRFFSHRPDRRGRRSHKGQSCGLDGLGEVGPFGQEAISWMDRIRFRTPGGGQHTLDVEIGLGGRRRADFDGHVGRGHVRAAPVGFRIHGNRFDSLFAASSDDAHGDLASVGNENPLHCPSPLQRNIPMLLRRHFGPLRQQRL